MCNNAYEQPIMNAEKKSKQLNVGIIYCGMCGKFTPVIDQENNYKRKANWPLSISCQKTSEGILNCHFQQYSQRLKDGIEKSFLDQVNVELIRDTCMAGKLEVRILETNALLPSSRLVTTFCNFDQVEMNIIREIQQEIYNMQSTLAP